MSYPIPGAPLRNKPWRVTGHANKPLQVQMDAYTWAGRPFKASEMGNFPIACTPAFYAMLRLGSSGWTTGNINNPEQKWATGKPLYAPPVCVQICYSPWRTDEGSGSGSLFSQLRDLLLAQLAPICEENNIWCELVKTDFSHLECPGTRLLPFHGTTVIDRTEEYSFQEQPQTATIHYEYGVLDPDRWQGRDFLQLWLTGANNGGPFMPVLSYDRVFEDYLYPDPFGDPIGPTGPNGPALASYQQRIVGFEFNTIILDDVVSAAAEAAAILPESFARGELHVGWGYQTAEYIVDDITVTWFTFLPTFPFPTYVEFATDFYDGDSATQAYHDGRILAQHDSFDACSEVASAGGGACDDLGELPSVQDMADWIIAKVNAFIGS